jgi:hypothetical protein
MAASEALLHPPPTSATPWSPPHRIAFRFLFVYLLLYLLPTVAGLLPFPLLIDRGFGYLEKMAVPALARHVLGISGPVPHQQTGSGDTLFAWVSLAFYAMVAAVVTTVWSLVTRRREHRLLHELLRIWIRYGLGSIAIFYGSIKVFPTQFSEPDPARLMQPYSEFSPMGVLWAFMGVSAPYQIISGLGEVAGGLLLLFRRTTTVGAVLLLGVMGNVVLLNFCYDVPVKQFSLHLWLMALFLAWPDLRPLFDTLVRRRAVPSRPVDWEPSRPRWRLALRIAKSALIASMVLSAGFEAWQGYHKWGPGRATLPFEGIWTVADWSEGSPPWLRVGLGSWRAAVTTRDQPYTAYRLRYDDKAGKLDLTPYTAYGVRYEDKLRPLDPAARKGGDHSFKVRLEGDTLHLEGAFKLRLHRVPPSEIPLLSRGFQWVQEFPLNR